LLLLFLFFEGCKTRGDVIKREWGRNQSLSNQVVYKDDLVDAKLLGGVDDSLKGNHNN